MAQDNIRHITSYIDVSLIQVPTLATSDETVARFYHNSDGAIKKSRWSETFIIIGDFRARVGNPLEKYIIGNVCYVKWTDKQDKLVGGVELWKKSREQIVTVTTDEY